MMGRSRNRFPIFTVVLCGFLIRALTPAGYMPATAGSGLLFELCPSQLPAGMAFMGSGHEHHAHHDESGADESEVCDVGHILSSAWIDAPAYELPIVDTDSGFSDSSIPESATVATRRNYSPRAPPTP